MVSAGPMCKYAQDLAPFLQVLVGKNISKLQLDVEVNSDSLIFIFVIELDEYHKKGYVKNFFLSSIYPGSLIRMQLLRLFLMRNEG